MTELTKEQLIDLITDKVYNRIKEKNVESLSKPLGDKHLCKISLTWEELAKAYKEKFNEKMPANYSAKFTFIDCLFEECVFDHIPFDRSMIIGCNFRECTFKHCNIRYGQINHSELWETHIEHCNLTCTTFRKSDIISSIALNSDFNRTCFIQASVVNTLFTKIDFTEALWFQLKMKYDNFHDCILKYIHIHLSFWIQTICTGTTELDNTSEIEQLSIKGRFGYESPIKNHFISVQHIGSRLDNTYYDYENDRVICGCWKPSDTENDYCGGPLDAFEERVKKVYPEGRYHDEYMHAIKIFRFAREDYLKSLESQK